MYISLKWKAVVFLSLVLIGITSIWTWQTVVNQVDTFERSLEKTHNHYSALLDELVHDSFLKLSQFSHLLSSKPAINKTLKDEDNKSQLSSALEKDWLTYNINLGIDYLSIYNQNLDKLGEVNSYEFGINKDFEEIVKPQIVKSNQDYELSSFIYCNTSCFFVVVEPFINDDGLPGTIVIAQNMADIVRIYYDFTKSGIGILIDSPTSTNNELENKKNLSNWGVHSWAISDYNKISPILSDYSKEYDLTPNKKNKLYHHNKNTLLIKPKSDHEYLSLGKKIHFIFVEDITNVYNTMNKNIEQGILTGLTWLVIAEIILLFLINKPMRKLNNVTTALHLLPKQQFNEAIKKVTRKKTVVADEITTLENSTAYVAKELSKLHNEIRSKNHDLKEQIDALTRSRSFLSRLVDNSQIFIITQNFEGKIYSCNKMFEDLFNITPRYFKYIYHTKEDLEIFQNNLNQLKNRGLEVFHQEVKTINKYDYKILIAWTHTLVEDEQGNEIILSIGMDQTKQKKAEKDLRWIAHHDSLTGIGNRRSFNTDIEEILRENESGALIFIDVNQFKKINDIYGHSAGDQILIEIAALLKESNSGNSDVYRFAGDEFILLLRDINIEELPDILNGLSNKLKNNFETAIGQTIPYSVSMGASVFPLHGTTAEALVINADMAMYHAKKKGLGEWRIFSTQDARTDQIKKEYDIMLLVRKALANNSFQLYYQPILNISKNEISHYEALIRLKDNFGEYISPSLFIPLAEQTGEIRKIDEWVINKSLASLKELYESGHKTRFAINIAAPTLQSNDFAKLLLDAIKSYDLPNESVIIELTETAYIENFQQVLLNLCRISKKGVSLALDDFGVGFSSFNYIKKMPLNYIKLDGSYIKNLANNDVDQVFVKSIANMVEAFGMQTIAEFVEDEYTLTMLQLLGVNHAQGYHIGKPESLDIIINKIVTNEVTESLIAPQKSNKS